MAERRRQREDAEKLEKARSNAPPETTAELGLEHPLLKLQRSAGNRAVGAMVAQSALARQPTRVKPMEQQSFSVSFERSRVSVAGVGAFTASGDVNERAIVLRKPFDMDDTRLYDLWKREDRGTNAVKLMITVGDAVFVARAPASRLTRYVIEGLSGGGSGAEFATFTGTVEIKRVK